MQWTSGSLRRSWRLVWGALAAVMLLTAAPAQAESGDFDPTFHFDGSAFSVREILFRTDGSMLLVGQGYCRSPFYAVKLMAQQLNSDGSVDTDFANDGVFCERSKPYTTTAFADAMLDSHGRLLMAGKRQLDAGPEDSLLLRLTRRGRLDRDFAGDGRRLFSFGYDERAASVLRHGGGRILVGLNAVSFDRQSHRYLLLRIRGNGSLDRSFGGDGIRRSPSWTGDFFRLGSGKILVSSNPPFRLRRNATLDRAYGHAGFGDRLPRNLLGGDYAATPPGGLIFTGRTWNSPGTRVAVVRWRPNGELDPTFGEDGKVTTELGTTDPADPTDHPAAAGGGVAVQQDGKPVITGMARYYGEPQCPEGSYLWRPVILRYTVSGELDQGFGDAGITQPPGCHLGMTHEVRAIAVQPGDGKILAWGESSLARVLP